MWWEIKKKKKPSTLIRAIRRNKNLPKERREREYSQFFFFFFGGKNMDWMSEMISNLYKIKWKEEESNYEKMKKMKEV